MKRNARLKTVGNRRRGYRQRRRKSRRHERVAHPKAIGGTYKIAR